VAGTWVHEDAGDGTADCAGSGRDAGAVEPETGSALEAVSAPEAGTDAAFDEEGWELEAASAIEAEALASLDESRDPEEDFGTDGPDGPEGPDG
jgi:hypothetical protein